MTLDRNTKKLAPIISMLGFGGGGGGLSINQGTPLELMPFQAEGGTKTGPSGGYFYHVFTSPGTFTITRGTGSNIEVMVLGGGASGRFGSGGPGNGGAGGGGGGGISVYNLGNNLTPASYNVEIGAGGDNQMNTGTYPYYSTGSGNPTVFGNPPSLGLPSSTHPPAYLLAYGGNVGGPLPYNPGPGGSPGPVNDFPTGSSVYSNSGNPGGAGAPGGPPTAPLYAGSGGNAGGYPAPPSNWWRPYISPGQGGAGKSEPYSTVYGAAAPGQTYGGGGGGAGGLIPYGEQYPNNPSYAPTPSGPPTTYPYIGTGAPGICVVRYPDAI